MTEFISRHQRCSINCKRCTHISKHTFNCCYFSYKSNCSVLSHNVKEKLFKFQFINNEIFIYTIFNFFNLNLSSVALSLINFNSDICSKRYMYYNINFLKDSKYITTYKSVIYKYFIKLKFETYVED